MSISLIALQRIANLSRVSQTGRYSYSSPLVARKLIAAVETVLRSSSRASTTEPSLLVSIAEPSVVPLGELVEAVVDYQFT